MSIGYQVFVMGLSGGLIVWDESLWAVETRLIAQGNSFTPSGTGDLAFRLLRATRTDVPTTGQITDSFLPTRGQYVAICDLAVVTPGDGLGTTFAYGIFESNVRRQIKDSEDCIGQVRGREWGTVFDQVPLIDLHEEDLSGTEVGGFAMDSPPTFNEAGLVDGQVIGNMVAGLDGNPQFANSPAHCNITTAVWDRWSMLEHVLAYVASESAALPDISLNASTAIQTLLQLPFLEVIPTEGLSLKGFFDLLCGSQRGLYWVVEIDVGVGWSLNIYSATDVAVGAIPAAPVTNITLTGLEADVVLHDSAFDSFDAVQIDGNRIICCGTINGIDGTLTSGWSSTLETDYQDGAFTVIAAEGTNLRLDQAVALNRMYRGQGLLRDVYTRYIPAQDSAGCWNCKAVSGVPVSGSTQFLCPSIDWSGTAATVDNTTDETPNVTEARLQSQLPWPQGVQGDQTDLRNIEQQARPSYLEPIVFSYHHPAVYQTVDPFKMEWVDLCHPPSSLWSATPSVSIDDRGPALRVAYSYQEMLGLNHYNPSDMSPYAAFDEMDVNAPVTPEGRDNPASDWEKLALTIAVQSDQRVRVINYRSGYDAGTIRNTLHVKRPDLNCWLVRAHTIIGMSLASGYLVPDEVASDTLVRNDFAVAQKLCDEIAAFAFRKRSGATITLVGVNALPIWAYVGNFIGTVTESNGTTVYTLNTMITNIYFDFSEVRPRIVITTSDPVLPESYAIEAQVPALGGKISAALGSTVASHTLKMSADVKRIDKAVSGLPVVAQPDIPSDVPLYGYVNWAVKSSGDATVAELCKGNGGRLPTAYVVAVSYAQSCEPAAFGNVFYRLEYIGMTTVATVLQRTYRAVMPMNRSAGVAARTLLATGSQVDSNGAYVAWGTVADHTATNITTQISGANQNNYLPVLMPSAPTSGDTVDLPSPAIWSLSGTSGSWTAELPCLLASIVETARLGGQLSSTPLYDRGETVVIQVYGSYIGSGGYSGIFAGTLVCTVAASPSGQAAGTNMTPFGSASATWGGSFSSGSIAIGAFVTLSVSFTLSSGKFGSPSVTGSPGSGISSVSVKSMIIGGRGVGWAGVG